MWYHKLTHKEQFGAQAEQGCPENNSITSRKTHSTQQLTHRQILTCASTHWDALIFIKAEKLPVLVSAWQQDCISYLPALSSWSRHHCETYEVADPVSGGSTLSMCLI